MATRICGKCHQEKPLEQFYKHIRDGYQSRCKDCKREESRLRNQTPQRKVYNQQFAQDLKENGYFREYARRPEVKKRKSKQMSEYYHNPELTPKFKARRKTRTLITNGTIKKQPCVVCGNLLSQPHHVDYDNPTNIKWLCREHHLKEHKAKAEGK